MHDATTAQAGRHIPFKKGGWGIALFITLLAVGAALTAGYVHKRTFREPTDVRFRAVGEGGTHQ